MTDQDRAFQESVGHARLKYKQGSSSAIDLKKSDPTLGIGSSSDKNASRDAKRKLEQFTDYPDVYEAQIVQWDPETQTQYHVNAHFLLVFEVLAWLVEKNGDIYRGVDANEHPKLVADRINWVGREAAGFDPMDFIITGLWLDAAPFSETNDSLYLLLFQILGIPDKMRRWIVCFNKKNQCGCGCKGRCTYDSVWNVVAWMYRVLKSGIAPTHRHDGVAFSASKLIGGQKRAKRAEAGYRLPKACSLRKKSDWGGV